MAYVKADDPTEQEYFDYLEDLRRSGRTNMLGAAWYLQRYFHLRKKAAGDILMRWMKAHEGRTRPLVASEAKP